MSAEWQPQRTSAATRRFKVWFGGIFLTIGLVALIVAAIVYLVLSQVLGMGALIWAFIGAPLALGVSFSALGGTFVWLGVRQARQEERLRQFGTTTEGTVIAIEPTGTRVNRRRLWHVRYTYHDLHGTTQEGESGYLNAEEARRYQSGDTVLVRYDPASPATSAWIGREDLSEQA
jgi:hypothetical protein